MSSAALGKVLTLSGIFLTLTSLLAPLTNCSLLYIVSGSMEPYVPVGSLVLLCQTQPSVGDIAAYSLYGKTVLHRVSSIDLKGGTMLFVADANPVYPSVVEIEKVRGVAVLAVPLLGYLAMNRLYAISFPAAVLAIVLFSSLYKMSERKVR
jgi:signal peptidase